MLPLLSLLAVLAVGTAGPTRDLLVVWNRDRSASSAELAAVRASAAARLAALGLARGPSLADAAHLTEPARVRDLPYDPALAWRVTASDGAAAARALTALSADPAVRYAEPIVPRGPCALDHPPDDPLFLDHRQWGLANFGDSPGNPGVAGADIHALAAWARAVGANDLTLAIADTGIDPAHPDLGGTMPDGSPRISGLNVTGVDPADAVADSFGHGTTVVGVMAARTNNGATFDSLGVAGVCGGDGAGNAGCRILALKITAGSTGFATDFSITAACIAAVNAGARALNLSFAGEAPSEVERETFLWALERGCVVVCAAGNHGAFQGDTPQYPAAYAAEGVCIQVGACDALGQRAAFSSYGPGLDVIAPGVGIWTTFMTYPSHAGASYPGYVPNSGTSLAAPFGTGTVGLLAAARHELEDTDFQQLLRRTASDVGAPGFDPQTGAGLLDAGAALAAVDPGIGIWHGVAAATQLTPLGVDTLVAAEDAGARREPMMAQRYEVDADVALPDSFVGAPLDSADGAPWAWARLGASNVGRGDFRVSSVVPGLAQASVLAGRLHLRAHVYQVLSGGDVDVPDSTFLPVAPESARIAFTVLGRVRHAPAGGPTSPPTIPVFPNPFAASVTLFGAPGASCAIFDASGRLVRRLVIRGTGAVTWDGRDGRGHAEPEGLYLARISNRTIKLLRIR